jgi:hypothetical protein
VTIAPVVTSLAETTVKATPLLATLFTVTTTLPVVPPDGTGTVMLVLLQLLDVPGVPLNVTVLLPCVPPKLVPVIVTAVPTAAEVGDKPVMLGPAEVTVCVSGEDVLALSLLSPP